MSIAPVAIRGGRGFSLCNYFSGWRVRIVHTGAHVSAVGAGAFHGDDVADFWL